MTGKPESAKLQETIPPISGTIKEYRTYFIFVEGLGKGIWDCVNPLIIQKITPDKEKTGKYLITGSEIPKIYIRSKIMSFPAMISF